jgi:peptidoglycan/LPS O-acetylase OafA/YrhL
MNTRADALLAGCLLGVLASGRLLQPSDRAASVTRWLLLAAGAVLGYFVVEPLWFHGEQIWVRELSSFYWVFALIALCFAVPIVHLLVSPHGRFARLLSWKPLVQVGVVSYGIYLWHNPLFMIVPLGPAGWLDLPVQFLRLGGTGILVTVSYRYLERPILRVKDRLSNKAPVQTSMPRVQSVASTEAL